jgi:hypothetical protein
MPVAFLLGAVSHLMPIAELDRQSSKLLDHTQSTAWVNKSSKSLEDIR